MTTLIWWLLLPLVALLGVILWATESRYTRINRLRRQGWTQKRIAAHLNCSTSTVRRLLTT